MSIFQYVINIRKTILEIFNNLNYHYKNGYIISNLFCKYPIFKANSNNDTWVFTYYINLYKLLIGLYKIIKLFLKYFVYNGNRLLSYRMWGQILNDAFFHKTLRVLMIGIPKKREAEGPASMTITPWAWAALPLQVLMIGYFMEKFRMIENWTYPILKDIPQGVNKPATWIECSIRHYAKSFAQVAGSP